MGMMGKLMGLLFGEGRNVVADTMGVFREAAEPAAAREAALQTEVLRQYAAEFAVPRKGLFDRMIDGLNRLPRPFLAFGTLGLFITAMVDPVWFASRMEGVALVPEPLWWLMGAIVSFYFGARHQAHSQEFQRSIAETMARTPQVLARRGAHEALTAPDAPAPDAPAAVAPEGGPERSPGAANTARPPQPPARAIDPGDNPALRDWLATQPATQK